MTNPTCIPIPVRGDDLGAAPFVGFGFEIMTPALPIPTRPRFFFGGEVMPIFAEERNLARSGDPDCVRGPEPDAPCATEETPGSRDSRFGENEAVGQGIRTSSEVDTLAWTAHVGLSFPFQIGERQLRFKPYFAWINYEVEGRGFTTNAACDPVTTCTNVFGAGAEPGFLRQPESLTAKGSKHFNGIGPGVDLEVDTGRFGPLGSSLFLGGRFYRILGDRTLEFGTQQVFAPDPVGFGDVATARHSVEVNQWLYRVHVGFRLQWLGFEN